MSPRFVIFFAVLVMATGILALPAVADPSATDAGPRVEAGSTDLVDASQYRLGSGDKIRVTTFGEESLSGEFDVSGAGVVSFPLIGDVPAGGGTVADLQKLIEAKLRDGYLKDPRVSIEVLTYRPFYILGEVTKPGEYPYTNGLTVLNAVATANGFTYRADTHHVYIRRADGAKEVEFPLISTTPVMPGDTIRIKERFF